MLIGALRALLTGKPDARDCDLYYVRKDDRNGDNNRETLRILLSLRREEWRAVESDLVAPLRLSDDLVRRLSLRTADTDGVLQSLLGEILGEASTDWSKLELDEVCHLLRRLQGVTEEDRARWDAMPLHRRAEGDRGCVDKWAVIADQEALPPELAGEALVFLEPDKGLENLYSRVPRLDRDGKLRVALGRDRPFCFAKFILNNLLERNGDEIRVTLPDDVQLLCLLRETPWLPARDSEDGVAPKHLIDLPDSLLDFVRPLAAALSDYRLPDVVSPDIWRHAKAVVHEILERPSRSERVQCLATALDGNMGSFADSEEYFILPCKDDVNETLIRGCVDAPFGDVPGWNIVRAAAEVAGVGHGGMEAVMAVARALCGRVSAKRQVRMLATISTARPPKESPVRLLYNGLMRSFARTDCFAEQVLPFIRVPTRDGNWRSACEVTVRDGVAIRHQLLKELCAAFPSDTVARNREEDGDTTPGRQRSSDSVLRPYFDQWMDSLIRPAVGAFLSLLGNGNDGATLELAQEWLDNVDVDLVRRELSPFDDGKCCADVRVFVSGCTTGDYVSEVNLCGKTVPMWADPNNNTIFAGEVRQERSTRGDFWVVQLRSVDRKHHDEDHLLTLLQGTVELWAERALGFSHDDALNWWKKWGKGSQVPIRPVRASILAHLPLTLRQLGVHDNEALRMTLSEAERAQQKREQAADSEIEGRAKTERKALRTLGELIGENANSAFVRQRVRDSMERSGYSTESVLLELIQNADDALAQAEEIAAQSGRTLPEGARHVQILIREDEHTKTVDVIHFGRPINYTGGAAFQDRQWDQDLYFMMLLNLSAKPGEVPRAGSSATGRFGLGFKSVHLVSDSPSVVSGFSFKIDAGLLPNDEDVPTDDPDLTPIEHHRPTRIRLPLRGDLDSDALLDCLFRRFHPIRSLLPAFARGLSRVVVSGSRYSGSGAFDGVAIDAAPGWSVSRVESELPGHGKWRLLRFRPGSPGTAALLVGLRNRMPAPLPRDVPFLWNVTPITDERWDCGYAISGPFKLDHGRTRVSLNHTDTLQVVDQLGAALGEGLVKLQDVLVGCGGRPDGLPIDETEVAKFVAELWKVLASGIADRDELRQTFLRRLHGGDRGISRWMSLRSVIPTELLAPFQERLGPLRLDASIERAEASLQGANLCVAMAKVEEVARLVADHPAVSGSVAQRLQPLGRTSRSLQASDIFRQLARNWDNLLTPERLHALRPVAQDDIWELLGQQPLWHSDFRARSVTGEEVPLSNLLLPPLEDQVESSMRDELRRARFAPDAAVLSREYICESEDVRTFCLLRIRHNVNAGMLTDWLHNLDNLDRRRQSSALKYLLEGDLRGPLLQNIVSFRQRPLWLAKRDDVRRALSDLEVEPWRRESLLAALFFDGDNEDDGNNGNGITPGNGDDAEDFFDRLQDWWSDEKVRAVVIAKFEEATWPRWLRSMENGVARALQHDSQEHWLALLVLGACRTVGRKSDEGHRAFLEFLHDQGWWDIFKDKHATDESWMTVLRQHQDPATKQLERSSWMSLFPVIYQCSRFWKEYCNTLRSAGSRHPGAYNITWLLAPRSDPHLTGAGQNFDAPPLPIDMGRHWILRELVRFNVITRTPHLIRDCWVPSEQVIKLLCRIGMPEPLPEANNIEKSNIEKSKEIFEFLRSNLNDDFPHLHYSFDIPLRYVARNPDVLGKEL